MSPRVAGSVSLVIVGLLAVAYISNQQDTVKQSALVLEDATTSALVEEAMPPLPPARATIGDMPNLHHSIANMPSMTTDSTWSSTMINKAVRAPRSYASVHPGIISPDALGVDITKPQDPTTDDQGFKPDQARQIIYGNMPAVPRDMPQPSVDAQPAAEAAKPRPQCQCPPPKPCFCTEPSSNETVTAPPSAAPSPQVTEAATEAVTTVEHTTKDPTCCADGFMPKKDKCDKCGTCKAECEQPCYCKAM